MVSGKLIGSLVKLSLPSLARPLLRNEWKRIQFALDTSTDVLQTGQASHIQNGMDHQMSIAKRPLALLVLAGIVASNPGGSGTLEAQSPATTSADIALSMVRAPLYPG
jgi:hypothetical protein